MLLALCRCGWCRIGTIQGDTQRFVTNMRLLAFATLTCIFQFCCCYFWSVVAVGVMLVPYRVKIKDSLNIWVVAGITLVSHRWLRLVGSFKSYISFAKELYKRDCMLQNRLLIWKKPFNRSHPIWYWCTGCLNLQVSFCKRATNYTGVTQCGNQRFYTNMICVSCGLYHDGVIQVGEDP